MDRTAIDISPVMPTAELTWTTLIVPQPGPLIPLGAMFLKTSSMQSLGHHQRRGVLAASRS